MSKGSTWNIWDFHLHTPCSILNNQFGSSENGETWERYIAEVERVCADKRIVAVGITDYFSIEGYKHVREYKNKGRLTNLLVFPNIEFRLNVFVNDGKKNGKRVNLHVIFSPEVAPEKIEDKFLHNLDFVYENEPFEPSEIRKLKISNLTEFGEHLQKQHAKFTGEDYLFTGCKNAVVQYDQIKNLLLQSGLKGNYLIVLAEEDLSVMDWDSQFHAVRKQLIQMSHGILSANPNTRKFYLGKTHENIEKYLEEFKSLKPCIWGSDSHGYQERFLEPDNKRYCWIKSEATWNGLKQIIYEPEHRVAIQEHNPEPDKSIFSISSIQISQTNINHDLSIEPVHIDLNYNLVTIIGGRGSGKTAILDLISSCFHEGGKLRDLKQSFFYRLYVADENKPITNQPTKICLGFKSGDTYEKLIGPEQDECCFDKSNVIYLTQNHFEEFSAHPNKLNEHIINLIFEKYGDEKRVFDDRKDTIEKLIKQVQNINLEIQHLQTDIEGKKQEAEIILNRKLGEKNDILQRIQVVEARVETKAEGLHLLAQKQNNLKVARRQIGFLLQNFVDLREKIIEFADYYGKSSESINQTLSEISLSNDFIPLPTTINGLNMILSILNENGMILETNEYKYETQLSEVNAQIEALEGSNKEITDLQIKLNEVAYEITETELEIKQIEEKEKRILSLNDERFSMYQRIVKCTIQQRIFLQEMIGKFESGKDEMLSNLSFSSVVDLRGRRLYIQVLADKVDNRTLSENALDSLFQDVFYHIDGILNSNDPEVDLSSLGTQIDMISKDIKLKKSTTSSDFYNTLLAPFFEIGLQIRFNDKILKDLSMGERAVVLLKILLALDDKPLLIDQPEEHLDNRYIYAELMPAFRSAKTKRQIIIATHNANLVVNTDAEQIIIANYLDGKLSYEVGTLEDNSIRDKIKTILEGGDEAFKKREEKYGYIF